MYEDDGFSTTPAPPAPRHNPILSFARDHVPLVASGIGAMIFAIRLAAVTRGDAYTATILLAHTSVGDAIRVFLLDIVPLITYILPFIAAWLAGTQKGWKMGGLLVISLLLVPFGYYLEGDSFDEPSFELEDFFYPLVTFWASFGFSLMRRLTPGDDEISRFAAWPLRLILLLPIAVILSGSLTELTKDRFWLPRERLVFADEKKKTELIGYVLKTTDDRFVILNDDPRIIFEKKGTLVERDFCYLERHKADFEKAAGRGMPRCP